MPQTTDDILDLDELADQFTVRRIPKERWTHKAHLAVGLWHVDRYGRAGALPRLRHGIRTLNESHGTANTESSGYHETITRAQVALLADFLARADRAAALGERYAQLLASPLADRNILLRFYSRQLLMSNQARAVWVEPDVAAICAEGLAAAAEPRPLGTP
jgi:hypothetical protein